MKDIQKTEPNVKKVIQKVGVRNVRVKLPIVANIFESEPVEVNAEASIYVDLNDQVKGTHMSRLVETCLKGADKVDEGVTGLFVVRDCLLALKTRLDCNDAYVKYRFEYYKKRKSPKTDHVGYIALDCELEGECIGTTFNYYFRVKIPYMSMCPCSRSISVQGAAHNQRSVADIRVQYSTNWIDMLQQAPAMSLMLYPLLTMVMRSASSEVFPVVKREDEKYIVDEAYKRPMFVEDVARSLANELDNWKKMNKTMTNYVVVVNHYESIHQHDATAVIRGGLN